MKEKAITGVVEVRAEAHPDGTTDDHRWLCVGIKVICPVKTPITLADIKADPELQNMVLANNTLLSGKPVTEKEWNIICNFAGINF